MAKRSPQSWFLSGGAANEGEFLRAARRTGALILIAPSIKSARTWLDRCTSPVEDSGRRDESIAPDGLVVDLQSQQAEWRGNSLELTTQELRLLAALAEDPGTVRPFAVLSVEVWGSNHHGDRSMVRSAVQRLRQKLDSAGVGVRIISVRGVGFRLIYSLPDRRWTERRERRLHHRSRPGRRPAGSERRTHPFVGASAPDQN